jgi:hypothetical protein
MLEREREAMTHSTRRAYIFPLTNSESEKDDKRLGARRERARVKAKLSARAASEPDFDLSEFCWHPREGQWVFAKDGKYYGGTVLSPDDQKRMRK